MPRCSSLALAFVLCAPLAAQDLVTYEPFAYGVNAPTVGDLNGKHGGYGFGAPWLGPRQMPRVAAWWTLESDANDSSGQKVHGVLKGSLGSTSFTTDVPASISAWSKKSLTFNGTTDYIDLTAHLAKFRFANMGTISAWFKSSTSGAYTIFSISDSKAPSTETSLGLSSGRIYFSTRGAGYMSSGSTIRSTNTYNDGKWHHVAWVVDRAQLTTIYVDGVSILSAPTFQALAGNLPRADTMSIGRNVDSGGPQWFYKGQLDDLSIFGVPLSAADVKKLAGVIPLAVVPKDDKGGPDIQAASLSSAAFRSRGLVAHGNRFAHRGTTIRHLAKHVDLDKDGAWYASLLLRRTDDTAGVIGPMLLSFHTGTAHVGRLGWGTNGGFRAGAGAIRNAQRVLADKTTYFVVLKWQTKATGNDLVSCKVYAPTDTVHDADSKLSGEGTAINQWDVENLAFAGTGMVDRLLFDLVLGRTTVDVDELRIGKTWDAVTRPTFGKACFGAQISQQGVPRVGSTGFRVSLDKAPASRSGFFVVGLSRKAWGAIPLPLGLTFLGAPQCDLNVSLDLQLGATTGTGGSTFQAIPVPNSTALVGKTIYVQWAIGSGGSTTFVTTEGLPITVMR